MDSERGRPGWCRQLIEGFLEIRKKTYEATWEAVEELHRKDLTSQGGWPDPMQLTGRLIRPPRVSGYIESLESQLFTRPPKLFVQPLSARQERLAEFAQQHMNADWRRSPALTNDMYIALRDCAKAGFAGALTTYTPRVGENSQRLRKQRFKLAETIQRDPETGQQLAQEVASQLVGPDSVGFEETVPTYERDDRAMRGFVSTKRIPYWMIAVDPNASCKEDAEWIARQIICPLEAVQRNPEFKNTKNLRPTAVMSAFDRAHVARSELEKNLGIPEAYKYVSLWEIFQRNDKGTWDLRVLADKYPEWLYEAESPYDAGCPWSFLRWNHDGDHFLTPSDIQKVLDLIIEESHLRTRLFDATMREFEDILAYDKTKIKENELMAMVNIPKVGLAIPLGGMNGQAISNAFSFIPKPNKSDRLLSYLGILERNIELGLGLGANQQLSALKSETSATEAAEIASWARARSSIKNHFFETFIAEIAHVRAQIGFQFYNVDMFAHTVSREGLAFLLGEKFTVGDIQNGLAVSVEKGSMRPASDETQIQLYTTMIQEAIANPILAQLYQLPVLVLRRAHAMGVLDGSELLTGVSAEQIQTAQMQMALMQQMGGKGGAGSPPRPVGSASPVQEVEERTTAA